MFSFVFEMKIFVCEEKNKLDAYYIQLLQHRQKLKIKHVNSLNKNITAKEIDTKNVQDLENLKLKHDENVRPFTFKNFSNSYYHYKKTSFKSLIR
jgi:hypothetical protein